MVRTYPLDNNLSAEWLYATFQQLLGTNIK